MKKIVSVIRPYVVQQTAFVFEDGNKIDSIYFSIDNINNLINLVEKYNINRIDLAGPKSYSQGVKRDILKKYAYVYTNEDLKINLI